MGRAKVHGRVNSGASQGLLVLHVPLELQRSFVCIASGKDKFVLQIMHVVMHVGIRAAAAGTAGKHVSLLQKRWVGICVHCLAGLLVSAVTVAIAVIV